MDKGKGRTGAPSGGRTTQVVRLAVIAIVTAPIDKQGPAEDEILPVQALPEKR